MWKKRFSDICVQASRHKLSCVCSEHFKSPADFASVLSSAASLFIEYLCAQDRDNPGGGIPVISQSCSSSAETKTCLQNIDYYCTAERVDCTPGSPAANASMQYSTKSVIDLASGRPLFSTHISKIASFIAVQRAPNGLLSGRGPP